MPKALWLDEPNPNVWLHQRSLEMDAQQSALFARHARGESALFAVGGYGRRALFPRSDIDLLLLTDQPNAPWVEEWVADVWSLGVEISPRISTLAQLQHDTIHHIELLTSLLDARLIAGAAKQSALCLQPLSKLEFIHAKLDEQAKRDRRAGKLEPNLKTDVGGLRDLHTMHWLSRYCYGNTPPYWFRRQELQQLRQSRQALHRLRWYLHELAPKSRDILTFADQLTLAKRFVPHETNPHRAVEVLMQFYYRHTYRIRQFNQRFCDQILAAHEPKSQPKALGGTALVANHHYLSLAQSQDLHQPKALWQLLHTLQTQPQFRGIHPELAHKLYQSRDQLITPNNHAEHLRGLRQGLSQTGSVHRLLEWLHRYGLLHRLIPAFWKCVGRMQYDLFHAFTVDHHSIRLAHFLDHFATNDDPRYPLAHALMRQHPNPAPLYFAALTHDIGKGHDGQHEIIGADLMHDFLAKHTVFSESEQNHIVQLITAHLQLSVTAQKQDLHDPSVIKRFAEGLPSRAFLDDLYLLTLADISATDQNLWNDWKAQLMRQLYQNTLHYLEHHALKPTIPTAPSLEIKALWDNLPETFFQSETPKSLLTKSKALCDFEENRPHHVVVLDERRLLVVSRAPKIEHFSRITQFFEHQHCAILEARIYQSLDQTLTLHEYTLNTLPDPKALCDFLESSTQLNPKKRRNRSQLQHFQPHTRILIHHEHDRSYLEIHCKDEQGLLSRIAQVLLACGVQVLHAKISTFGERVEDHFTLQRLSHPKTEELQSALEGLF